jgi:hypothetical protein
MSIADCTEAVRLDPTLAAAYRCRGAIYATRGQQEESQSDLTQAERLGVTVHGVFAELVLRHRGVSVMKEAWPNGSRKMKFAN